MAEAQQTVQTAAALREMGKTVCVVLVLVVLIRSFVIQAYHIPSGSMEDTLLEGDYVIGDKLTYGTQVPDRLPILNVKMPSFSVRGFTAPEPGDLVIFEFSKDPSKDFIKRCVAVEGQVIEMKNQVLYVDGEIFSEPSGVKYTDRRRHGPSRRDNWGPETVPENHLFMMGDNRDNSYDSRSWGTVSMDKIKAHPLFIYFSWKADIPAWRIWEKVRWGRLGLIY